MMKQAVLKPATQAEEMLALIDAMTRQSQWLALNVTLEAARAGEQGRDLAAVAEQVGELVERMRCSGQRMQDCLNDPAANDDEAAQCIDQVRLTLGEVSAQLYALAARFRG